MSKLFFTPIFSPLLSLSYYFLCPLPNGIYSQTCLWYSVYMTIPFYLFISHLDHSEMLNVYLQFNYYISYFVQFRMSSGSLKQYISVENNFRHKFLLNYQVIIIIKIKLNLWLTAPKGASPVN